MMEKISWDVFHTMTKYNMPEVFGQFVNKETQSFWMVWPNMFYAITDLGNNTLYLNMMVGTHNNNADGLRALIKALKQSGVKTLKFGTYEGNDKILAFYKYIKATFVKRTDNYYKDGKALLDYQLDLETCTRFK